MVAEEGRPHPQNQAQKLDFTGGGGSGGRRRGSPPLLHGWQRCQKVACRPNLVSISTEALIKPTTFGMGYGADPPTLICVTLVFVGRVHWPCHHGKEWVKWN